MPDLTLKDLRFGRDRVDIRFWREDGTTRWLVMKGDPNLLEYRDYACGPALPSVESLVVVPVQ